MKKSLDHLPKQKRDELDRITSIIRALCNDVEMIILFGSYARGDWKEEADLKPERKSGHKSDYDILTVTENKSTAVDTGIWHEVTRECDTLDLSTHVRIITHDIQYLNTQLAEGQYFFTDIKKESCLLFDSGNFKLARKRELKPEEKKRIAQDYFTHWHRKAESFFIDSKNAYDRKDYEKSAFELHQAAECAYKTLLLVFTGYNPNEHCLGMLGEIAAEQDVSLADIFPKDTEAKQERFELLDYAYIGARYDPDYKITREDLEYLSERVKLLLELTEEICKAKIESLVG